MFSFCSYFIILDGSQSNENNSTITPTEQDTKAALNVIVDYLTESMTSRLLQSYDLTIESLTTSSQFNNSQKRKSDWETSLEVYFYFFYYYHYYYYLLCFIELNAYFID